MAQEFAVAGPSNQPAPNQVDRFFELSLLGLLASGFLAVAGSGYLDVPTIVLTAAALVIRTLMVAGLIHFELPPIVVTLLTLGYIVFCPADYFLISRAFIPAAIHLVFFVAVVKIVTGHTDRDFLLLKVIAFLELLAACIVSASFNFFVFLLLFLVLGVATFASSEIRQSRKRAHSPARITGAGVTARLVGVVLSVSLAILVITSGLFFFLPRTARAAFQHLVSHRYHLAGFSNHVTLGEIGEIKQENVPVMHVKMDRPEDRALALKWRGAALSQFNGRAWFNRPAAGQILQPDRGGLLRLDDESPHRTGRDISYAVYLSDLAQDALFFAGTPQYLRIDSLVVRRPFGNYSAQFSESRTVSYQVFSRLDSPAAAADPSLVDPLPPDSREMYLQLPRLDPRIRELARNVVRGEASPSAQAILLENYLRSNYGYTLELPKVEPDDPLAFFLFHRKKGHCEYFASAMAVMLRVLDIPSRVITGFQSGVYNPISGSQLIRTFGCPQLGGGLAARSRLDHLRSHAARSERGGPLRLDPAGLLRRRRGCLLAGLGFELQPGAAAATGLARGRIRKANWIELERSAPILERTQLERTRSAAARSNCFGVSRELSASRWMAMVDYAAAYDPSPARPRPGVRCHAALSTHAEGTAPPRHRKARLADALRICPGVAGAGARAAGGGFHRRVQRTAFWRKFGSRRPDRCVARPIGSGALVSSWLLKKPFHMCEPQA